MQKTDLIDTSCFALKLLLISMLLFTVPLNAYSDTAMTVKYQKGLLTVQVKNQPLTKILEQIALNTGIEIILNTVKNPPITIAFTETSLEEGIKRLSRDFCKIFTYAPLGDDNHEQVQISKVHLYDSATGAGKNRLSSPRVFGGSHQLLSKSEESINIRDILLVPDAEMRQELIANIKDLGDEDTIAALTDILLHDQSAAVRMQAALAFGEDGSGRATEILSRVLNTENTRTRLRVMEALSEDGGERAMEVLRLALSNKHENVRIQAVGTIGMFRDEKALQALVTSLKEDTSADVRTESAYALSEIGGKKAESVLRDTLQDDDMEVRTAAFNALQELGGVESAL